MKVLFKIFLFLIFVIIIGEYFFFNRPLIPLQTDTSYRFGDKLVDDIVWMGNSRSAAIPYEGWLIINLKNTYIFLTLGCDDDNIISYSSRCYEKRDDLISLVQSKSLELNSSKIDLDTPLKLNLYNSLSLDFVKPNVVILEEGYRYFYVHNVDNINVEFLESITCWRTPLKRDS